MGIRILGVNHRTAPVEVREQLAIEPSRLAEATSRLLAMRGVREAMILSTCNRVELLTCHEEDGVAEVRPAGLPAGLSGGAEFQLEYFDVKPELLRPHLYEFRGRDAVRHLFRIASSLDSMVVGEPQILGQVKESYSVARSVGAIQVTLERLLQSAFTTAKRVRTETKIGSSSVSIASVAVELAQKIFGSLEGKTVLLVGAGKMSELAARHLLAHGATSILVTNRTPERAERLAGSFSGQVVRFDELYATADQADIIITSTGAPLPIFRREHGHQFMQRRRNRPMFFIDIAVPRDVDPEMNRVEGVFVYDIDDLQTVATSNMADRSEEAARAEAIVTREVERYHERGLGLDAVPAIQSLQRVAEQLRQDELKRAQTRLLSLTTEQQAAVDALTRGLMNKFLHQPMMAVKSAAKSGDAAAVETIRNAFQAATEPESASVKTNKEVSVAPTTSALTTAPLPAKAREADGEVAGQNVKPRQTVEEESLETAPFVPRTRKRL